MKVTIKEIAKACNVSISLVSRIANNDPTLRCTKEVRERVVREIENQKYAPDYFAKNLANNSLKEKNNILIGCITYKGADRSRFHPYFDKILEGITAHLDATGYKIVNYFFDEIENIYLEKRHLASKQLDGLILFGEIPLKLRDYLIKESKFVSSIYGTEIPNADFVGSDVLTSMNVALDYIKEYGYESFGLISGGDINRVNNLLSYASSIGLKLDENFYFDARNDSNTAYLKTLGIIKNAKPSKIILCMNDEMAIGVMNALIDNGYKIPEDVSIIGHDDINRSRYCSTPLTTVKIYKEEIGRLVAELLIERINSQRKFPIRVYVPTELVVRKSVRRNK